MTLEAVVAKHYRDFITLEDILRSISEKYRCPLEKALLVVDELLTPAVGHGALSLYGAGELRPRKMVRPQGAWKALHEGMKEKRLDSDASRAYRMILFRREEIKTLLDEAGIPLDTTPCSLKGKDGDSAKHETQYDGSISQLKARILELKTELEEANAEIHRLSCLAPLYPTKLTKIVNEIQCNHWGGFDPHTGKHRPNQKAIIREAMKTHDLSERTALAATLVAARNDEDVM
ncbi:hypothetical protein ABE957_10390 [Halomonas sp. CS7]|uniref:DUF3102 domain-containing protein n=1 Tax=Halomonas pelophila TaxID=3151122 RepID=A0ABV1N5V5_9GAMM